MGSPVYMGICRQNENHAKLFYVYGAFAFLKMKS